MAVDMSQFYQVFFEETAEHLENMERMLLDIDLARIDDEQMNAIFRAAHSIKGSAGTFGFQDLADVTHELETLLDRVRKHDLAMNADIVDASIEAGDLLRHLLAAHRGEGSADLPRTARVCVRLRALYLESPPKGDDKVGTAATHFAFDLPADCPDPAAVVANMCAEFCARGLTVTGPEVADGGGWHGRAAAGTDAGLLRDIVEFAAQAGSFRLIADEDDAGWGLFEQPPAPAGSDDGFGFFDDAPGVPAGDVDPGYGFFEPLNGSSAELPVLPAVRPAPPAGDERPTRPGRSSSAADASIRVGVDKVDQIINLVGELVITQAMLASASSTLDPVAFERLLNGVQQLERNTRDLQASVMSIRMLPISMVFSRFPRVVRDLSQKLGKQVRLVLEGESTELDRGLIERLADPLTHLVRNSLDHGIEGPDIREAAGKPREGTITLKAFHQSGHIVVEVIDDGAGLNRERILAKARERELPAGDNLSDQEVWSLIFEAGFSTAEAVTEVSGRGVGMDVVKRNITSMGGRIDIDSLPGSGTRMTVRLPLTLAILDGMSVGVGSDTYIVPLNHVVESLQPEPSMIKSVGGEQRLVQVRNEFLTVLPLSTAMGKDAGGSAGILVILESDGEKIALSVDELLGQHQVVIKSLEANYRKVPGISGATIMGDGHVGLILDVPFLVQSARHLLTVAA
ncbi:chemotaxis protein CheW [Methyloversatilis thermotolerans]|uniref:chemotaxis protein CheW n=1 Tax=Methyloversatilis thermotolerans TaxID=1346290 RepID=UPI000382699C|nr:chemotaxis protein CheW [Methyloversatilis thermotolerans]